MYDEESEMIFNWPANLEQQTFENLKPAEWGELVSLDKTLPEFHEIAIMVLGSSIVFVVVFAFIGVETLALFVFFILANNFVSSPCGVFISLRQTATFQGFNCMYLFWFDEQSEN